MEVYVVSYFDWEDDYKRADGHHHIVAVYKEAEDAYKRAFEEQLVVLKKYVKRRGKEEEYEKVEQNMNECTNWNEKYRLVYSWYLEEIGYGEYTMNASQRRYEVDEMKVE